MEFSECAKASAIKFLEDYTKKCQPPSTDPSDEDTLPVKANFPRLVVHELEAECLEMARGYLARL